LPDLVGEALEILARFRTELVSDQELEKAKRRFLGDLEACYDDLESLCGWFGGTELFYRPRSQEQRAQELRRVARRVIRPERLNVAVVGSLRAPLARKVSKIVHGFR